MASDSKTQKEITRIGNPAKPTGTEGRMMLERMNQSHSGLTDWAIGFWKLSGNERVLDIGCGGGGALKKISELLPDGSLFGVDYSEVSVGLSIDTNRMDIESGKMRIVQGSVENLPFENDSFDRIITVESFYFWPNHEENLKEVLRVLSPGGSFLLAADIYNKPGLSKEAQESVESYGLFNPTAAEFKELFEKAGFADVMVHTLDTADWICVEGKSSPFG